MSVTYQGPIRVNQRVTPTFDGSGLPPDNTGVVLVGQTVAFSSNAAVSYSIPGGSLIDAVYAVFTTGTIDAAATFTWTLATSPSISFTSGALGAGNRRVDIGLAGVPISAANTGGATVAGTFNVNSGAGAQSGFFVVRYFVRNPNGTYTQTGGGQSF